MKKKEPKTTRRSISVFHQIVQHISPGLIERLARDEPVKARAFSYASHVLSLVLGHITHAFSLNELCDAMAVHAREACRVRGMAPAKRNTLSNANRTRAPAVAERLYWKVRDSLAAREAGFAFRRHTGPLARFKDRVIAAVDSTTLQLSLSCIDWARHRRRKAAAKTHMRMDVATMLPTFAVIESAKGHDSKYAAALCEGLGDGDILLADRAYNDFAFLHALASRGVRFVLRAKRGTLFSVARDIRNANAPKHIIADEEVRPAGPRTAKAYPGTLRRVTADVVVDGRTRRMVFITNSMDWSAATVVALYKARWAVELLFKELKQTLQLRDFYGENENAVKWQVWTALLAHLLLRFIKHLSRWRGSFSRLVGIVRSAVWMRVDLLQTLRSYGTAPPPETRPEDPRCPYLPGLRDFLANPVGQQTRQKHA